MHMTGKQKRNKLFKANKKVIFHVEFVMKMKLMMFLVNATTTIRNLISQWF